jgi:hypothetical protein
MRFGQGGGVGFLLVRLEPLCAMDLGYVGSFHLARPYGNEAGLGWGIGEGSASGARLSGSVRWSNHPVRRGDGVMLPDVRGVVVTAGGDEVFFNLAGRTSFVQRGEEWVGRQLLAATFESEADAYSWLNAEVCMAEGVIDPQNLTFHLEFHLCKNDLV